MYTRSYYQDNGNGVPRDYDGNAFRQDDTPTVVTPTYGETKISPEYTCAEGTEVFSESTEAHANIKEKESESIFSRIISCIPFKKLPFGSFGHSDSKGRIEMDDIIIIAVALLLLFSGDGDKLLGIALLALLFV